MTKKIDTYILNAAPFAQPILNHLRELVHTACPAVEETVKWGFPHFDYKGEMMCSMASFKKHCSFGFWKASLMSDSHKLFTEVGKTSMGHLGAIKSMDDLPKDKIIVDYIKEAMRLNDEGIKVSKPKSEVPKKAPEAPGYFMQALKENKKALKTFEGFSPSNKKEYIEWVTGAKSEATRDSRLEQAIEWMAEGKAKNWKYIK